MATLAAAKKGKTVIAQSLTPPINILRRWAPRLPQRPPQWILCQLLNKCLADSIKDGDFDFLTGQCLAIEVQDFHLRFALTLKHQKISISTQTPDATISAHSSDLLGIVTGDEDPDSLFFQRKLIIAGNTELGLTAKNTLDAIDRSQLPAWLTPLLSRLHTLLQANTEEAYGTGLSRR